MNVTIRGTRGSIPVASSGTQCYGGNTTCIEILTNAGERIIIDAGSGIRALGDEIMAAGPSSFALCFTHAHWDHLLGFPMFAPIFSPESTIHIHAPHDIGQNGIRNVLGGIMDRRYFPVTFEKLPACIDVHEFEPGSSFRIGSALVETCATHHPGGCVAYRVTADGWSFFFSGDHEACPPDEHNPACESVWRLMRGSDVALVDAQYTDEEYLSREGWGHSAFSAWPARAAQAGVRWLLFSHHDPARTDDQLDAILSGLQQRFADLPVALDLAMEGMSFSGPQDRGRMRVGTCRLEDGKMLSASGFSLFAWIDALSRELARYNDMGVLLDRILQEGRDVTFADAGTIFLVEGDHLVFANIHNDTLFPGSAANKYAYAATKLPLNNRSVAGYVALEKRLLNIQDMYQLPEGLPFQFNASLDQAAGYRTVSTLTVPITGKNNQTLGVIQLINSKPETLPKAFSESMEIQIQLLATHAGITIERANLAKDFILRMLHMTSLRDPRETGPHVQRVGSYAAELYHCWAERRGVDIDDLRYEKGMIRLAAMLHDVGKVGIADTILKKPGKLTAEEYEIMKGHSALGAEIFASGTAEVDGLACAVALHHHQKWDGTGYTGTSALPLRGEDIPLAARITAVADVYDALCSKRCYKDAWTPEKALETIRSDAGTHFDPEIVSCLEEIWETIEAIRKRYPDDDESVCTEKNASGGQGG